MRDASELGTDFVRLTAVSVRAGDNVLLDKITLSIRDGTPTAIVGPNGAGKTTLLRTIMGLIDPAEGTLDIRYERRAIVFQKPVMLRRSVSENVSFALEAANEAVSDEAVTALLDQVGLSHLSERHARHLSGGEQQRLAIARALARRPDLLLLDEATASLDPAQTKLIEDLMVRISASGVKIIFATHDLGQARRLASDVVLLVNGRMAEHAAAANFFAQPQTRAARQFVAGELVLDGAKG